MEFFCSWCYLLAIISPSAAAQSTSLFFVSSWKREIDTGIKKGTRAKANSRFVHLGVPLISAATDRVSITMRGGDIIDDSDSDSIESETSYDTSRGISASLFLTYLTVMGAKCALPSTLAILAASNSGLTHHGALSRKDVLSRLLCLSTLAIASGKLLLGPVIDSLGGICSLQITLLTLFICLSFIGIGPLCPTLIAFAIYWIIIDIAFSACWAACVSALRAHLPEESWAKEIGRLAMAARLGNAISFTAFASLLQWAATSSARSITQSTAGNVSMQIDASWRWVFRVSGVIQLIPLLMLTYFRKKGQQSDSSTNITDKSQQHQQTTKAIHKATMNQSLSILRQQSRTAEFWLHLISRSILMILVSFLLFIPSYMTQCFDMSSAASARVGSIFALGCLISVSTLAEKTYPSVTAADTKRYTSNSLNRRKSYSMLAFLSISTFSLLLQTLYLQDFIHLTPLMGTLLIFLFGFSLGKLAIVSALLCPVVY